MKNTKRITLTFSKRCNMRRPFFYGSISGKDMLDAENIKGLYLNARILI